MFSGRKAKEVEIKWVMVDCLREREEESSFRGRDAKDN